MPPPASFYDLTVFSYILAFSHFFSELFIFRSASLGAGVLSPLIVACKAFTRTVSAADSSFLSTGSYQHVLVLHTEGILPRAAVIGQEESRGFAVVVYRFYNSS